MTNPCTQDLVSAVRGTKAGIVAGGARSSSPPTCHPGGLDVGNVMESHNGTLEQIKHIIKIKLVKVCKRSNLNQYLKFDMSMNNNI